MCKREIHMGLGWPLERKGFDREGLPVLTTQKSTWLRRSLFYDQWNIGLVAFAGASLVRGAKLPDVRWLPHQRSGIFVADPFFVNWGGRQLILCEVYDYRLGRGRIGAISLDSQSTLEIVLDLPVHAAFPFPIKYQGKLYCIPETVGLEEVAIYDISDLSRPTKAGVLLDDVAGCDCAVMRFAGRWWMFGTDARDGPFDKLRIWYADDLLGRWRPHPMNPVKVDLASSRSAGAPFLSEGVLYRPAQDCSTGYGSRVVIHRVVRLTPTEFEEQPVTIIKPDDDGPYPDGLHTLSLAPELTLIDGKRVRSVFLSWPVLTRRVESLGKLVQSSLNAWMR